MTDNVHLNPKHGSMSARIAARMKPSNEKATASETTVHGHGPQRVVSTIHHSGSNKSHGGELGDGDMGDE